MKELGRLMIYLGISGAAIFALAGLGTIESLPNSAVGIVAILIVIILPVFVVIRMAKKEQQAKVQAKQ